MNFKYKMFNYLIERNMKKLVLMAFGLCMLAACSQDEVMEVNRNGDEITFDVVTNAATRAADVYCNNNHPGKFYVSALSDGKTYIDEDELEYKDNKWVNNSGTRYWPETPVDFYAYVNDDESYDWSVTEGKATAKFENFTVEDVVANQVDLLYAVKTNQDKDKAPVVLNFRHALSQIVFQAKNTNKNLYVKIAGVKVANVGNTSTFTFPSNDTDGNIVDHTGVGGQTIGTQGTWGDISGEKTYDADFSSAKVEVPGDNQIKNLTNTTETEKNYGNVMLLLPQNTTAWDPETDPLPTTGKGTYFLVDCVIYNVAGENFNATTDVCLWGDEDHKDGELWGPKELAIPVEFDWEQGKKYVYTFVFGNGNGGYDPDPDPDPDPDEPDPVLVPISFEITVDDFVEVKPDTEIESGIPGADAGE